MSLAFRLVEREDLHVSVEALAAQKMNFHRQSPIGSADNRHWSVVPVEAELSGPNHYGLELCHLKGLIRRRRYDVVLTRHGRVVVGQRTVATEHENTVIVEHAHIIKRHTRPNPNKNVKGGIVEKEGPINASNVMIVCSSCGKHTRIGHTVLADGKKVRSCRRCGTTLDK